MDLNKKPPITKRGSSTLVSILLAVIIIALSGAIYSNANSENVLTGAVIGVQTIKGECNISITSSILNIGHDYECTNNTHGFIINANNVILDCQYHTITCIDGSCGSVGFAGVWLNNRTNITIQNCYIYNFTNGIKLSPSSSSNRLLSNRLYNNTDGIDIENGTANNLSGNIVESSINCGINISMMNNSLVDATTYNNIWNNKIFNNSGGAEACNDLGSYNYWYLEKSCSGGLNIRDGPCLGGNWWRSYTGKDTSGDGLGDTLIPYTGGKILQAGLGDIYPLTDVCGEIPAVISENTTCTNKQLNSSSGEGYAITQSNVVFTCNNTDLNGNGSAQSPAFSDDMRGIEIVNVHDVTVVGCRIHNFTYGIYIQNAYNIRLANLTIYDNNKTGIYIGSLAYNVTVESSTIGGNYSGMQSFGIYLRSAKPGTGNNKIFNNSIYNNTLHGIYLGDSSDTNSIYSNYIYNNSDGILVNDSDGNSIYNNRIRNNTYAGIRVLSSSLGDMGVISGATDTRNSIYGNVYGYLLDSSESSSSNGITGKIYQNRIGIYFNNSDPNIKYATLYENTIAGIIINNSNPGTQYISINNVTINGSIYGLYAINATKLKFSDSGLNEYYNNTYGLYFTQVNSSISYGDTSFGEGPTIIHNNTHNIVLENSRSNLFDRAKVYGGFVGINVTNSVDNNFTANNVSFLTQFNLYFSISYNNTIYNNYIDNSTGGIDAYDNGSNHWNTSKTQQTNIIGNSYIGGNYWSQYVRVILGNDTTGDGIGDVPANYSISGNGGNNDSLPLTIPLVICGNISSSFILYQNMTSNGTCMNVVADNLTLNFNHYSLIGNGSGIGVNITGRSGVIVINAQIINFTKAIFIDPSDKINITSNTLSGNLVGIELINTNNSYFYYNNITNNSLGINVTVSYNNSIYNNLFNNTDNARDDGSSNHWNGSYDCTAGNGSIIFKKCSGGNFWNDYTGRDTGGGIYPYNTVNDGIGDTNVPYTDSASITGGDALPLAYDNGSTTLGCQSISTDTLLSADVLCSTGNGITIAADSITLDCDGKSIRGGGIGSGIIVDGRKNIIIKNCNISSFYYGIKISSSKFVQVIEQNNLELNDFYALYLLQSNHTIINSNTILNDNNGVYSINSMNTTITNNSIDLQKKFYGIYLFNSETNIIANNSMWDNYHAIYLVNSSGTNISSNNISGSDVYSLFVHKGTSNSYIINNNLSTGMEGIRIKDSSYGNQFSNNLIKDHSSYGIYSTDSNTNTYFNNTLINNSINVFLSNSTSNTINNNTIISSTTGLQAINSSNSLALYNNTINSTTAPSLEINDSSSATLKENKIYNQAHFNNANYATITNNNTIQRNFNLTGSNYAIVRNNSLQYVTIKNSNSSTFELNSLNQLTASAFAAGNISYNTIANNQLTVFDLHTVTNSKIYNNDLQNNSKAIVLYSSSNTNQIYTNWIKNNGVGLNITGSTGNTIYNNYFENTKNVADDSGNTWYTTYSCSTPNIVGGPCRGGNFYSDYSGLDNGASSREQGDGIGDQPAYYTIATGNTDTLPLVLYAARQYYAPTSGKAAALTATANASGTLSNNQIVSSRVQTINYSNSSTTYVEITAWFNQSDVHAETLKIDFSSNKTAINKSGVTGIDSYYSLYLYHNNGFDTGVYLCPDVYNLDWANSSCTGKVNLSKLGTNSGGINLSLQGNMYKIGNITNDSMIAVLNNGDSACGGVILHNMTLNRNISCSTSGAALSISADNIIIDFAGYALKGNGSGIGINISNKTNVVLKNAIIQNYSTGIYVNPSSNINISNNNISYSYTGINFNHTNNSYVSNNKLSNNTFGLNLSTSYNNTIYNNIFNNTVNVRETGAYANTWNISLVAATNIYGGSYIGGNYWNNYTGWDTDLDGIGETLLPHNESNNFLNGDSLPLTEVGQISAGNVTTNVTLGRNVTANGTVFNFSAVNDLIFDCAGYSVIGSVPVGWGFYLQNSNRITIRNCTIQNFSAGIVLHSSNNNTFNKNYILNNTIGINITNSGNNTIYNNHFNNTNNSVDNGINRWNVTYNCSGGKNILGDSCMGGNYWSNYNGSDNGNPIASYNMTPWNISGDEIGDTLIPYNNSESITSGGDYLPLTIAICGDGQITGTEACDGTVFGGLTCASYGFSSGALACNNNCLTISTAGCSNGGGGSTGGSSGGGGGGSSSKTECNDDKDNDDDGKTDYPDDPGCESLNDDDETDPISCTQSWQCGAWSSCVAGTETRECYDTNDCLEKKQAGEAAEVISVTAPAESRTCAGAPTPSAPEVPVQPVAPEEVSLAPEAELPVRTITLSSIALVAIVGGIYAYWMFGYPPNRLRRRLNKLKSEVDEEYYELLKNDYLSVYNLYLKLSENHKQNFYAKITEMREKIEENLKAEKKMEELLESADQGEVSERKKAYLRAYNNYQKLPEKVKQKYYPRIVRLRDRLERS